MTLQWAPLIFSAAAGAGLGLFYFSGLWWTLRRLPSVRSPSFWLMASFLVRAGLCLLGFYLILGNAPERLLAALAAFLLCRTVMVRWLRPKPNPVRGKESATGQRGTSTAHFPGIGVKNDTED
ncbi:MAG: ATP synthase subunit I [Desulfatiglandales bacterium]